MKKLLFIALPLALLLSVVSCNKGIMPVLEVPSEVLVGNQADTVDVPVVCNALSKATLTYDQPDQTDWLMLLPRALFKDGYLRFFVKEYDNVMYDRSATITMTNGDLVKSFILRQSAKDGVSITDNGYQAPKNGGKHNFYVRANKTWSASVEKGSDWITLSQISGDQGETNLEISFSEVSGIGQYDMRVGKICFSTGVVSEYLTVYQGFGVLINGLRWAECNIGEFGKFSSGPADVGCMYQFTSDIAYPGTGDFKPAGFVDGWVDCGLSAWEAEKDPSPQGWRIPTKDELENLIGYDKKEQKFLWLEASVSGFPVDGVVVGLDPKQMEGATAEDLKGGIFIPASGFRSNKTDANSGKLVLTNRVCVQSNTTPNDHWNRYVYGMGSEGWWDCSWNDKKDLLGCVRAAFPIRCVTEIPE